jgi:thioredoxin-related protein
MKTIMLCLLLLTSVSTEWLNDFDAAKQKANEQNKMILLNFSGSDWCAPCVLLKKEVFETAAFQDIASKDLVLLQADFPRQKKNKLPAHLTKHNEALAEKYNPNGKFPLTLLLNADGKVLQQWDGYVFGSQDKFLGELQRKLTGN